MKHAIVIATSFAFYGCAGQNYISQSNPTTQVVQENLGADNSGFKIIGRGYDISGNQITPPIETLLIDPLGRKTGYDSVSGSMVNQIPHSGYEQDASIGIDSEEDVPAAEQPPAESEFEVTQPMSGEYKIQLYGKTTGKYETSLSGVDSAAETNIKSKYFGLTEKGLVTEFKLSFDKTPGAVSTVIKTVTFQTLKDDLRLARQLGFVDNDGMLNSLNKKLENAEEQYKKGQKEAANNMLEALVNEVKAQTDKHVKKAFADPFSADIAAFTKTL